MTEQRLPSGQVVYDPRGNVTVTPMALAPRRTSLNGLRIGFLDNSKWNASKLLRHIANQLETTVSVGQIQFFTKQSFSKPAESVLIDTIAESTDIAITAIGD